MGISPVSAAPYSAMGRWAYAGMRAQQFAQKSAEQPDVSPAFSANPETTTPTPSLSAEASQSAPGQPQKAGQAEQDRGNRQADPKTDKTADKKTDGKAPAQSGAEDPAQLSEADLAQLTKLQSRDTQVRQHEAAHLAAAGGLALSGASFSFQRGPDGAYYAIGGEVSIDVSPGRTPEETADRARRIRTAALAPADPSSTDVAVAAKAQQMELQARAEQASNEGNAGNEGKSSSTKRAVDRAYGVESDHRTGNADEAANVKGTVGQRWVA
ncbi:putative metalloprotease CJM1_0395 family protein [Candidatus Symbiobacter mobilis]|nr:putative metalloprotease CJM1_0395 family protein [Candidatus Symbiobacter mobilis]